MSLPVYPSFIDVLEHYAAQIPEKEAYRLINGDGETTQSITYRELEAKVLCMASHLQEKLKPGDRALLIYGTGIDFVVGLLGCLYSGVIAIPVYPPHTHMRRLNMSLFRLQSIIEDAEPQMILTTTQLSKHLAKEPAFDARHGERSEGAYSAAGSDFCRA